MDEAKYSTNNNFVAKWFYTMILAKLSRIALLPSAVLMFKIVIGDKLWLLHKSERAGAQQSQILWSFANEKTVTVNGTTCYILATKSCKWCSFQFNLNVAAYRTTTGAV